jgi:hypothetical protein
MFAIDRFLRFFRRCVELFFGSKKDMKFMAFFLAIFLVVTGSNAQPTDVRQTDISGSAPASALGTPFGQSFVPTSLDPLFGVALATVDNVGAGDIHVSLWHSDASGKALVGSPITGGTITAAQINSFQTGVFTPLWFPIYFDQQYNQVPGEHLAFTLEGGGSLNFYFAASSSYKNGQLLGDAAKDLTFATVVVPEPGTAALLLVASSWLCIRRIAPGRKHPPCGR